jgi:hypothetical protein
LLCRLSAATEATSRSIDDILFDTTIVRKLDELLSEIAMVRTMIKMREMSITGRGPDEVW